MTRRVESFSITSLIQSLAGIGVAVIIAVFIEWQFTRHPYHVPLFFRDFAVRLLGCAVGLTVARFGSWRQYHYFVISGVILTYILMDAPKIESYFPIDPIDRYPFRFLPLMWAKIAWFVASVAATVVGSMIGERIGKRLRERFFMDSLTHPDSAV